uniref:Disintegrin domain-containing protein n=1 Tax=Steinernema glaseri TaxID=37863 RepID=A0A1I7YDF6_9BILA
MMPRRVIQGDQQCEESQVRSLLLDSSRCRSSECRADMRDCNGLDMDCNGSDCIDCVNQLCQPRRHLNLHSLDNHFTASLVNARISVVWYDCSNSM